MIRRQTTTTITLTPDEAAEILRDHFGAGAEAEVTFECGFDQLHHILITSVSTNSDDE